MPHSEEFDLDDSDSDFIAVATQIEAFQNSKDFAASPRPTKCRRLNNGQRQLDGTNSPEPQWSEQDDTRATTGRESPIHSGRGAARCESAVDDDDLGDPETDSEYYFPGETGEAEKDANKSKYRIHVPKEGGQFQTMFFTQTQAGLDTSPGRFRGAVWKKPSITAPPPQPPSDALAERSARSGGDLRARAAPAVVGRGGGQPRISSAFKRVGSAVEEDERLAILLQAEEDALLGSTPGTGEPRSSCVVVPSGDASHETARLSSNILDSSAHGTSLGDSIMISSQPMEQQPQPRNWRGPQTGLKQMTIFGQAATQDLSASQAAKKKHAWPLKSCEEPPTHHKLNEKALEQWVYPTNLGTVRDYQFNIVSRSLIHNTLVALPTGLGKTFIAATIMLNYYRWTANSQLVFMAPTKPLIAQQMDACYHIVGIPRHDTVLMTGESAPAIRAEQWTEKRVFFMTPQTVVNDLKAGICDPKRLVLLVVDEAHKATGGYAYTEVISFVRRFNSSFRVLALTATPGSTVEAVQAVIDNLDIARVELRTESSIDIRQYTHEKHTETELFDYSDEQCLIMEHMSKALRPTLDKLTAQNAYWSRDPMQLTAYGLTTSRQKWASSDAGRRAPMPVKGMVNSAFTVLSQLAHSIGLLKNHGIGPFYSGILDFKRNVDSGQSKGKTAAAIAQSQDFVKTTNLIGGWMNNPDFIGHPKLHYLREVVLNHFLDAGEGRQGRDVPPSATRVMVFASWRDSTEEICRVLKRNEPMIRPHVFVGQAGKAGSEGMNQKKQNEVVQDFKSGKYNTLVATSIGEEGLDIGDVDLIVCYDASSSPIRMLQRIGRTGRKRIGRVVLLLMKGKEENDYVKAQDNYSYIQKSIADTQKYTYRTEHSPRILPKGTDPKVDMRVIEIPVENSQPIDLNEKSRRAKGKGKVKRPPKKFNMPDGVRTSFVSASKLNSELEGESGVQPAPSRRVSAKKTSARMKEPRASPEPEAAQLPFLGDVILNSFEERELEWKYARTADETADPVIRAPDPTAGRQALCHLDKTKYVRHGRAAQAITRAMQAVHGVDDAKVKRMKEALDHRYLTEWGDANARIARGAADVVAVHDDDDDLPSAPLPAVRCSKPRERRRKARVVERSASARPIPVGNSTPTGARRQTKTAKRIVSYHSAAEEGDESEPEPTPADMRLGTQGIDLGTQDTSGADDDDEEADSELDAFIAKSDEIIETVSSSLPPTQEPPSKAPGRGLKRTLARGRKQTVPGVDADEGEGEVEKIDSSMGLDGAGRDVAQPLPPNAGRKRRVVAESDDSE